MGWIRPTGCLITLLPIFAIGAPVHERETTSVTWSGTISRIMIEGCGSCHRDGGPAFSLLTYEDARPWAVAIRDEIMARTMPPWGAVKGFGEFRNDQGLSPNQMNLIISWVEGGVPEGSDADLPEIPEFAAGPDASESSNAFRVSGPTVLDAGMTADGLIPASIADGVSLQIVAELPDGRVEPLLWLYEYRDMYAHPFLFEQPVVLPAGTVIRGVPDDASIAILPLER